MKLGFVFPGQGAQTVGMGKDLYESFEEVRKIYDKSKEVTGIDVAKLTFESTEEELSQTKNTQIAILTMSLGILEVLNKNGIDASYSAGLSLGEYAALIYSNIISLEDGLRIIQKRGEYMQSLVPEGSWAMAAVIGLPDEEVERICKEEIKNGFIVPANYNCPGQVAVSGDKVAITELLEKGKELGARKVVELKTSGPFHTEKLKDASDKLREELDKIEINKDFTKKVFKNLDAKEYTKEDDIKNILAKHVMSPVRFSKSIENMINQGVDTFIEIGPGKVLSGFIRKINKEVKVLNIQDKESLENTLKILKEEN